MHYRFVRCGDRDVADALREYDPRMNPNPSVGPSSILGWATFAAAEATTVLTAATGSEAQLNGPGKWTAILGIVSLGVTNAGRYLQSHAMIRSGGTAERAIDAAGVVLPSLEQELQNPPPPA